MIEVQKMKKLKRGLDEISHLFDETKVYEMTGDLPVNPQKEDVSSSVISVIAPDFPADSHALNAFVASQVAASGRMCSMVSLSFKDTLHHSNMGLMKDCEHDRKFIHGESHGENLTHITVPYEQFEKICGVRGNGHYLQQKSSQVIFLDAGYETLSDLNQVIAVLDKWIFLLQPTFESMSTAYKMMKAARPLNRELEYFIIVEGEATDPRGSILFEKFSAMVEKFMGIHLFWLGNLRLSDGSHGFAGELLSEHLFLDSTPKMESPDKIALADFIQQQYHTRVVFA